MALARTLVDSTAMPVRAQRDGSHQSGGSGSKNRDVHFFLSCFPEIPLHSPSALARRIPALRAAFGRSFEGPAKSSFQRGKNCTRSFKTADLACSPPEFQSAISIFDPRSSTPCQGEVVPGVQPRSLPMFSGAKNSAPALYE